MADGIDVEAYFAQSQPARPPSRSRTRVSLVSLLGEAVGVAVELCNGGTLATTHVAAPADGSMSHHAFRHAKKEVEAAMGRFSASAPALHTAALEAPAAGRTGQVDVLCAPLIQHSARKPSSIEGKNISQQSALVVGAREKRAREGVELAEKTSRDLTPCMHSRFRHAMHTHHHAALKELQAQWQQAHFLIAAAGLCEEVLTIWTDALLFAYSSDSLEIVSQHHEAFQNWLAGRWQSLQRKRRR